MSLSAITGEFISGLITGRSGIASLDEFITAIKALESANLEENQPHGDVLEQVRYMHDQVITSMAAVRSTADRLEKVVADDLWPLPKYSEILFIK